MPSPKVKFKTIWPMISGLTKCSTLHDTMLKLTSQINCTFPGNTISGAFITLYWKLLLQIIFYSAKREQVLSK